MNCENCGRTVLANDSVCWHCGHRLPKREKAPSVDKKQPATQVDKQVADDVVETPVTPPAALWVYGGITAVILVGIFLIMGMLARQPLVVVNANTFIRQGWRPFTDEETTYTFDHPDSWVILEKEVVAEAEDFDVLFNSAVPFDQALLPFSDKAADFEPLVIGISNRVVPNQALPAFIIVGESQNLSRWTYDEMIDAAQKETPPVDAIMMKSVFNDDRLSVQYEIGERDVPINCEQQIIRLGRDVLLVAVCLPVSGYTVSPEVVADILTSFQLLGF